MTIDVSDESVAKRQARTFAERSHQNFIGGQWTDAVSRKSMDIIDPGLGATLGTIAASADEDIDLAVAAARRSFDSGVWRNLAPAARSEILWSIADAIEAASEELALIESLDNGMPVTSALAHVHNVELCFRYYAGLADKIFGHSSQMVSRGHNLLGYTLKEPIGVAGLIVPWNAPLRQTVYKVAPALAAGCSIVLKPAEETSLTALRLAELMSQLDFPAGVFNVVTGFGQPAGARLAAHDDVDKVSFTGSTEVGRAIVRAAAGNLKKLTLELGGKSPLIVFDDADLALTVPAAAMAIFGNSGQICSAASRLIVHRSIYDSLLSGIAEFGKTLKLGYCTDPGIDLGPLISSKQLERVSSYVRAGRADGAEVLSGGERLDRDGYFFPPTVLSAVPTSSSVFQEEIFGPVLAAVPFDDLEEAVALANNSDYGLAASVFTQNVRRAHAVAGRIRAGRVGINIHSITDFTMPGGGYKRSGWGRENGPGAVDEYLETKSVFTLTD